MKKSVRIISLFIILLLTAAGCAPHSTQQQSELQQSGTPQQSVLPVSKPEDGAAGASENESAEDKDIFSIVDPGLMPDFSADTETVDLTQMSSTMVYAEVLNMLQTPEYYIGKKVVMEGAFSAFLDEETGKRYFACIIRDATACCAQGIEFVLEGNHVFPDDYPEPGEDIKVSGIFDTYLENGYIYCQLINAIMEA